MLICIYTKDIKEKLELDINSIPQFINYLQENRPDLWEKLQNLSLGFGLADSKGINKTVTLYPETLQTIFVGYDTLVIGSKIEGNIPVIPVLIAIGFSATTAAMIAPVVAMVVNMVIMIALSMLMQMLIPTPEMPGDPSSKQKSLVFNGVSNITEQGGAIPLVFGKCIFGGVRVGMVLMTNDIAISKDPAPDKAIPEIFTSQIDTVIQGNWYRVK